MRTLFIDTATPCCRVGFFDGPACLVWRQTELPRGHARVIQPMAAEVLQEAALILSRHEQTHELKKKPANWVDRVAVCVGPGSFTGIRVGVAFAQGFAAGASASGVALSSLDILAAGYGVFPCAVWLDARATRLYAAVYKHPSDLGRGAGSAMELADAMAAAPQPIAVFGDGGQKHGRGQNLPFSPQKLAAFVHTQPACPLEALIPDYRKPSQAERLANPSVQDAN